MTSDVFVPGQLPEDDYSVAKGSKSGLSNLQWNMSVRWCKYHSFIINEHLIPMFIFRLNETKKKVIRTSAEIDHMRGRHKHLNNKFALGTLSVIYEGLFAMNPNHHIMVFFTLLLLFTFGQSILKKPASSMAPFYAYLASLKVVHHGLLQKLYPPFNICCEIF